MNSSDVSKAAFLIDLFDEYKRNNVLYCLLRNYESLPEYSDSRDVDILIDRNFSKTNNIIVERLAKKYDCSFYIKYSDERFDQLYLYKKNTCELFFELKLDFFFDSELYGVRLISGLNIILARKPYRNFYIANDAYKLLDKWLFGYLLGEQLPKKYHSEFKRICISDREVVGGILTQLMGDAMSRNLLEIICSSGFNSLPRVNKNQLFFILIKVSLRYPLYHIKHIPLFLYYRLKNLIFPMGEFISLSGPDGSGKTTILGIAKDKLESLFSAQSENYGHFRPSVLPRIANLAKDAGALSFVDDNYSEPHRGKPSGFLGSLARFTYYSLDYLWGYFTKIRPALVRRELVIYDRYFFDMVADPGRSRINLPLWIRKLGLKLLPLPHTAFFVHVSPEVVRQRKQELSFEKIEEVNFIYLEMVKSSHMVALDNNGMTLDAVANVVDVVVERRRKRLKLD